MVKTMVISKRLNLQNIFVFLFLILFPFGQIIRLSLPIFGFNIPILPIDLIAITGAFAAIISKYEKPDIFKYFYDFLFIAVLAFLFSFFIFSPNQAVYGLFYLIRLWAYIYFFVYVYNFVDAHNFAGLKKNSEFLLSSLLSLSLISSLFGWIQFFKFPDIKPFFVYGWDEHLYRLVGTFLDPTFLGLIIVFGIIISINRFIKVKRSSYLILTAFLMFSLAFTYSRASFLAFLASMAVLGIMSGKIKKYLLIILVFAFAVFFLPTSRNKTIELFRTFSAIARVENYKETLAVFSKSPIYGIGYNNLCIARQTFIGYEDFSSHSCSGSDSSLLFILATMGFAGLFSFLNLIIGVGKFFKSNLLMIPVAVSIMIHSIFSNSIFYSFIMGYLVILMSSQITRKN